MTSEILILDNIPIKLERKRIKNLHLAVYPPDGHVRCSVPHYLQETDIMNFLNSRLQWIKIQQKAVVAKSKTKIKIYEDGETHYFLGKPYTLEVINTRETPKVELFEDKLRIYVYPGMDKNKRAGFLFNYYLQQLRPIVDNLMKKWLPLMKEDSKPVEWNIETMKRQWGKCYPFKRKIVLNLMLAKASLACIEYVLVHELVHLKIHGHGRDFKAAMTRYIPNWSQHKRLLNSLP